MFFIENISQLIFANINRIVILPRLSERKMMFFLRHTESSCLIKGDFYYLGIDVFLAARNAFSGFKNYLL
jgi:hypothetical protein